jgi:DNA (cytosine-5)-methyltransferase 1
VNALNVGLDLTMNKFPYEWNLKDGYPAKGVESHGLKVFSTFSCGGGSTMGYKLAGYNVLGCNEIDKDMISCYRENHKPKYSYLQPIQDFKQRDDLPDELFDLDILDGSPPCSSFSMAGNREKDWGKDKKFREGQSKQILDDLFFDFLDLADKLKPKVIIAENVKGMIQGNAKGYVIQVKNRFNEIGYKVKLYLFNAASMGGPQRRQRVFFLAHKEDLDFPDLKIDFKYPLIPFSSIEKKVNPYGKVASEAFARWWRRTPPGKSLSFAHPKGSYFNASKVSPAFPIPTIIATDGAKIFHYSKPNQLSDDALKLCGSYPMDYNFLKQDTKYLIGMSVPPVMTAQIANQIYLQWFKK